MKHFREGGTAYVKKLSTLKKLMDEEGEIGGFHMLIAMQDMAGKKISTTKVSAFSAYCTLEKGLRFGFYFPFEALTLYHKNKKD